MWEEQNNKLHKKFEFKNFSEAFAFMSKSGAGCRKNGSSSKMDQRI